MKKGFQTISLKPFGITGAPGEIRTPYPLVRSQVLYPDELRARLRGRIIGEGRWPRN